MIFVDTSAFYALADDGDPQHEVARQSFQMLLDIGEPLLTHNYVVVETLSLIQRRLGLDPALRFAAEVRALDLAWVDEALHDEAIQHLAALGRRRASLVDHVSFLVMRQHGITTALAFDQHFINAGFQLYGHVAGP